MKTTEELQNELEKAENVERFLAENQDELLRLGLSEYLNRLLILHGVEKSEIFHRARMTDTNYGYELFQSNRKHPSRDKLIRLCMGYPLTVDETQMALKIAKLSPLYPRIQRDAYLLFAIQKGYSVDQTNDLLYEKGEAVLE